MKRFRALSAFLILGAIMALGIGLRLVRLFPAFGSSLARPAVEPGNPLPDFSLTSLDGQTITLEQWRGHPVVINFWATWCPPCRDEMPLLEAAFKDSQGKLVVIGVNYAESPDKVSSFVRQAGITFPIALDQEGIVAERYQVSGYPTTFFVNAEGTLVARHLGQLNQSILDAYLQDLGVAP